MGMLIFFCDGDLNEEWPAGLGLRAEDGQLHGHCRSVLEAVYVADWSLPREQFWGHKHKPTRRRHLSRAKHRNSIDSLPKNLYQKINSQEPFQYQ